jgi:peptide/nickel transport system permease protein
MRFTDLFFVIPSFVLMIIVAAVVGPSLTTMLIVIGVFSWATTARIVRGQVLSIKERGYIERIRSVGGGNFYIMTRHVLPAVVPLIIVQTVLLIMNSIFFEISLDFVGLGDPAIVSWGSLLFLAYNQGISIGMDWLVLAPGYAIIIFLVGVSFLGFGLDEVTNPRLRRR